MQFRDYVLNGLEVSGGNFNKDVRRSRKILPSNSDDFKSAILHALNIPYLVATVCTNLKNCGLFCHLLGESETYYRASLYRYVLDLLDCRHRMIADDSSGGGSCGEEARKHPYVVNTLVSGTLLIMHKSRMILDFYGGELLMLILFLVYYTVWLWAVLPAPSIDSHCDTSKLEVDSV